jgi:CHAT domain-containing protein/Tfp pilus assembly protein PilF
MGEAFQKKQIKLTILFHKITAIVLLFFFLNISSFAQVTLNAEIEVLRTRYDKALQKYENEPRKCIPIYEALIPEFEKKQDWIYYYKALIEVAWATDFGGNNSEGLQKIEATIKDYQSRELNNYYRKKLADAIFTKGIILANNGRFDEAISSYQMAYDHYDLLEKGDVGFADKKKRGAFCLNNISKQYMDKREYTKALEFIEKAIVLKKDALGAKNKSTLRSIRSRGEIFIELGYFNQALEILDQVTDEFESENHAEELAKTQRSISRIYQRKKDFTTAEEYIRKSISIYDTLGPQNLNNKVYSLHQMGNVLKDGGKYEESIKWFEQSIALKNKISGSPNYDICFSTLNIGKAYSAMGEYEKSLEVYQKAWDLFDQVLGDKHPKYVELWLSMGNCYLDNGQLEKAHDLFLKAYNLAKEKTPERGFDRVTSCLSLARTTQDLDKALMICQEGLWEVSSYFEPKDVGDNPLPQNAFSEFYMLRLLEEKAALFQKKHQVTQVEKELELALQTYQAASDLVGYSRQSFFTESAKQFLAFTEVAFQLMEKSRSLILLESLQTEAASKIAKIPDSLDLQRQKFRRDLLGLETQFNLAKNNDTDAQELNDQIFSIKKSQRLFEKKLAKDFPVISQIQRELDLLTIVEIQTQLSPEETLLEFLITDDGLFVLKISDRQVDFFKQPHNVNLEAETIDFIGLMNNNQLASQQGAGQELFQKFTKQSFGLYQSILEFALNGNEQKLILIPDLYMNYLPFELLLNKNDFDKEEVNYADLPYLFSESSIRYSFSANLQFQDFIPGNHNQKILAFAPKYKGNSNPILSSRGGFLSLAQTSKEVASITSMINGVSKIGITANEKNFKALASNYGILHLAMHAYTNEENPMLSGLIFSENEDEEDDVLHAYELYGMKLNAQLAVLSACNTGSGKFEKGEGVMSLARSFRQAGVPNIVMSLWQADDESTRTIMENFYTHLKTGMKKDEALRNAKLDFLKSNYKTFPHYWSAFVLMGNDAPIEFIQPTNYLLWGFVGVLLFGLVFYFYRKSRT